MGKIHPQQFLEAFKPSKKRDLCRVKISDPFVSCYSRKNAVKFTLWARVLSLRYRPDVSPLAIQGFVSSSSPLNRVTVRIQLASETLKSRKCYKWDTIIIFERCPNGPRFELSVRGKSLKSTVNFLQFRIYCQGSYFLPTHTRSAMFFNIFEINFCVI